MNDVGEPCAGEPHARFEVAAGGNQTSRANTRRTVQAPPADPTVALLFADDAFTIGSGGEASRRTSSATSWKERLVRLDPWK